MNEADIPIDIHAGKLLDWLVSRRIVDKNWHLHIRNIRNKISEAITDMPAHDELLKLLSGAHINYFHCRQIVEILKTTEADSRNVFGRYGSQRMKDWQEIIKMYEKQNLYLAEAAQILVRNISYEIPGIRKQIKHLEQLSEEAEKKIEDLGRSEKTVYGEYQHICKQLSVSGTNLRKELVQKVFSELPGLLESVATAVGPLRKAIELYAAFVNDAECLPLLKHVIGKGNTTVYEYVYGEPPLSVEEPTVTFDLADSAEEQGGALDAIDFGDNGGNIDFGTDENIDFGDALGADQDAGEIDWGAPGEEQLVHEVDPNISLAESGIVVEEDGHAGGVAKGPEAYTVLDSPTYRDRFTNDLLELEAFLRMRLYQLECADKTQLLTFTMMDSFPDHDVKSLTGMLTDVEVAYGALTAELLQHLQQIKHSPEYVDILTANIHQKLSSIEKMKDTVKRLQEKSINFKAQSVDLKPTQLKIIDQTRTLQQQIERDISGRYKNRTVNLYGTNL
ncbi:CDK5RAP3-like protein [Anopheles bellator]|uniref:CDK5RAP3-like protein n=1 Tax=Anopheles bellator TaxID=139047 RepID=UPI002647C3A1|nr:CDK5RAP3-like protein [Anopheles bellator]